MQILASVNAACAQTNGQYLFIFSLFCLLRPSKFRKSLISAAAGTELKHLTENIQNFNCTFFLSFHSFQNGKMHKKNLDQLMIEARHQPSPPILSQSVLTSSTFSLRVSPVLQTCKDSKRKLRSLLRWLKKRFIICAFDTPLFSKKKKKSASMCILPFLWMQQHLPSTASGGTRLGEEEAEVGGGGVGQPGCLVME